MLVAIFNERESHAAFFLQEQDMTRYDAVNFLSHGVAKDPAFGERRPVRGAEEEEPVEEIVRSAASEEIRATRRRSASSASI